MKQETEDKSGQFKSGDYGVSANSKFLFMKWKRDFFGMNKMCIINQKETDKVEVPFWVFAQYLFLRVMNESISHGGKLRFDEDMPYSPVLLAETFGLDAELAKRAFSLFERYNLVRWDEEKSLIIPCAMANIGQQGAGSSTERSRKCRAAKKLRELGEKANGNGVQRGCNTMQRCSNACNAKEKEKEIEKEEEKDKEEESPPHNPPQGGEVVDLVSCQNDSSVGDDQWESVNPNTNGASGFAPPSELNGQYEYPLEKIQKAYDAAHLPQEDREAFCDYVFKSGDLENRQKPINILPAYLKKVHKTWVGNGGRHADAPQITREELSEYVSGVNATLKLSDMVTPETEEEFWKWLAAKKFKDREHVISKWNVNDLFSHWWQNFRKGVGNGGISAARKMQEVITRTTCLHSGDYVPKFRN